MRSRRVAKETKIGEGEKGGYWGCKGNPRQYSFVLGLNNTRRPDCCMHTTSQIHDASFNYFSYHNTWYYGTTLLSFEHLSPQILGCVVEVRREAMRLALATPRGSFVDLS